MRCVARPAYTGTGWSSSATESGTAAESSAGSRRILAFASPYPDHGIRRRTWFARAALPQPHGGHHAYRCHHRCHHRSHHRRRSGAGSRRQTRRASCNRRATAVRSARLRLRLEVSIRTRLGCTSWPSRRARGANTRLCSSGRREQPQSKTVALREPSRTESDQRGVEVARQPSAESPSCCASCSPLRRLPPSPTGRRSRAVGLLCEPWIAHAATAETTMAGPRPR